jgi:hypothetical protein
MSKSIKLKDNNYLDSAGVMHNRKLLSSILNSLIPVVLYDNVTGTTGNITLSDSAANYTYLKIFFYKSGVYSSQEVYNPNGKTVALTLGNAYANGSIQFMLKQITINGTTITSNFCNYLNNTSTTTINVASENTVYISRVVGYK